MINERTTTDLPVPVHTNVSDIKSGLNVKSVNEGVRGPLGISTSSLSDKAIIVRVAGGLGLRVNEEDGGGDNAIIVRGRTESLGAEDGSVGGFSLPPVGGRSTGRCILSMCTFDR
jgi:hypothetical protein